MTVTVVFEGVSHDRIRVVVDPLAELGTTLHAVMFGDHHGRARSLREELHKNGNSHFFARASYFQPLFGGTRARYLLPLAYVEDGVALHDRIDELAALDIDVFVRQSTVSLIGARTSLLELDLLHNEEDLHNAFEAVARISRSRVELLRDLVDDPEGTFERFRDFLHACADEWFLKEWEQLGPRIRSEATERRRAMELRKVPGLLEAVPTARLVEDPMRVVFDKVNHQYVLPRREGIILLPSYHLHPHLFVKDYEGYPVILSYAVEPSKIDSVELIQRRIAVLNDAARREICRALLRTPRSTSDLAQRMHMTEPQMSRHLRALREVGIVTSERSGRFVMYSLDPRSIATLGTQLLAQLHR